MGLSKFQDLTSKLLVNAYQANEYLLNNDGAVMISDVVFKQINQQQEQIEWDNFLSMVSENLNDSNYLLLKNGEHTSSIMNKFACGEVLEEGLFEFIKQNPSGYTTTSTAERHVKFWGWNVIEEGFGPCPENSNCICNYSYQRYTIFWTWTGADRTVITDTGICS